MRLDDDDADIQPFVLKEPSLLAISVYLLDVDTGTWRITDGPRSCACTDVCATITRASAHIRVIQVIAVRMLRASHQQIHGADLFYLRSKLLAGDKLALKGGRIGITRRNQVTRKEGRDFREKTHQLGDPINHPAGVGRLAQLAVDP